MSKDIAPPFNPTVYGLVARDAAVGNKNDTITLVINSTATEFNLIAHEVNEAVLAFRKTAPPSRPA